MLVFGDFAQEQSAGILGEVEGRPGDPYKDHNRVESMLEYRQRT